MTDPITAETKARKTNNREPESVTGPLLVYGTFQLNCQILARPQSDTYEIRLWEQGQTHGISTTSTDVARALWQLTLPFLERRNIDLAAIGPDIVTNSLIFIQKLDELTSGAQALKGRLGTPTIHVTKPPVPQHGPGIGTASAMGQASIGVRPR